VARCSSFTHVARRHVPAAALQLLIVFLEFARWNADNLAAVLEMFRPGPVRSGRIEARIGLRMMPPFPRSPLTFRKASFPCYG
jgi:hypothetical protein